MTELARAFHLTLGWMSRAVDALVKQGLLERVRDQHDRRLVHVKRTDKGTEVTGFLWATLDALAWGNLPAATEHHRPVSADCRRKAE